MQDAEDAGVAETALTGGAHLLVTHDLDDFEAGPKSRLRTRRLLSRPDGKAAALLIGDAAKGNLLAAIPAVAIGWLGDRRTRRSTSRGIGQRPNNACGMGSTVPVAGVGLDNAALGRERTTDVTRVSSTNRVLPGPWRRYGVCRAANRRHGLSSPAARRTAAIAAAVSAALRPSAASRRA